MKQTARNCIQTITTALVLAAMAFLFFTHAAAAKSPPPAPPVPAPTIEILNPTPNAVLFTGSNLTFEVEIKTGQAGATYKIEWEPVWDGTTPTFAPSGMSAQFAVAGFPALATTYSGLRSQFAVPATTGPKHFRVKVTDVTNSVSTPLTSGKYYALSDIVLTGYTWLGASTGICVNGTNPGAPCSLDTDCLGGGACGNDALGWTSFSCSNQNLVCPQTSGYSVRVAASSETGTGTATLRDSGWMGNPEGGAYSSGWMSFDRRYCSGGTKAGLFCTVAGDCPGGACVDLGAPPTGDAENWGTRTENSSVYSSISSGRYPSQVAGWARFLTDAAPTPPADETGWVHLRGPTIPPPYTGMSFHECSDCSPEKDKCNICEKTQLASGDPKTLWKNYACNSCYGCTATGDCSSCEMCSAYGLSYDSQQGKLVGYAWAGSDPSWGFGWMQFNPSLGGVALLQAWLATRYGDIFVNTKDASGRSIVSTTPLPSPPGTYNATYLIQANGTIAFTSQAGYLQPQYPSNIKLPTQGNQYINVLGRIDVPTLTTAGTNRYGTTVDISSAIPPNANGGDIAPYLNTTLAGKLDGKIYYYKPDAASNNKAVINSAVLFKPGFGDQNGAGTIIIDGDLTINANVAYDTNQTFGKIINLPSVAWIVLGNLTIAPSVGAVGSSTDPNIVGAFLVIGSKSGVGHDALCGNPQSTVVGGGVVSTGQSSTLPLIIHGLIMAKCFNFERTVATQKGSEQIVYDGKMIANSPPGLQDLTAVLPVIREVTP
ncbi:MAG: hypothetical protein V1778_04170 [bacterium]